MLAVLFILVALCPLNFADFPIRLLSTETPDGVLASRFSNAFLLALPNCTDFGNQPAKLLYTEVGSNVTNIKTFQVPDCPASKLGYLLQDLKSETNYSMMYTIGSNNSSVLTENTTTPALDYKQIDSGLPARSGAMVVITVLLSLAMVILLAGLIVSIFFSG
ncbi:uroplakin-2 [Pseudorasbora parva]|uniref:uroplakin-2 n=1 Tax=Pseudorasbora parva TaxID=51549 RepID=UPI00351E1138